MYFLVFPDLINLFHFQEDFIPDDLNLTRKGKKRAYPNLKPNAVPSIFSRDRKDFASSECKGPKVRIGPNKFLKKMKTEKSGDAKTVYLAKKLKEKEHINMRSYCSKLEQDLREKQREIESLKEQMQNFKSFLNQDQIDGVMRNSSVRYWSDQTVTECLKIRHACGKSGYDYLRSKGFPFPNILLVDDQNQASQISGEVVMLNPPKIQDDPLY